MAQLEFLRPYRGKPGKDYSGACYNSLMEEETKESLALMYIDALDTIRRMRRDGDMYAACPRDLEDRD